MSLNIYDYIVIAALAVCVGLALFFTIRRKKNGGCSCSGSCGNCCGCPMAQSCDESKK